MSVRLAEHSRSIRDTDRRSGTFEHVIKTNHKIDLDNVTVIDTENRYLHRKIKEAIWIRTQKPNMNRETGIQLSHIYDTLLTAPPAE